MDFEGNELAVHERAQDVFASVLAGVKRDQLGDPTPCPEWSVRDLIGHVIAGNSRMAGVEPPAVDEGSDLVATHAASAVAAQARFAGPGGLTDTYDFGRAGQVPGSFVIGIRASDVFMHAWDLATATGQPTDLDPELAETLLTVSRERMRPDFRGEGRPFAPEQPCDPSRPPADRLAAFLGREVH